MALDSNHLAILITFSAYLILLIGIGLWGDRKSSKTYKDFIAAGKGLGGWVSAISSAASAESAWVMLGLAGLGYSKGIGGYWAAIACIAGFAFNSIFIMRQLRKDSQGEDILTLTDWIEKRTGDKGHMLRIIAAIIAGLFMLFYVVAQFTGSGKAIEGMGLFTYEQGVIMGGIIIGIYVLLGGYMAVCFTDLIQGLLMVAVMIIFPFLGIQYAGGLNNVIAIMRQQGLMSITGGEIALMAGLGFIIGNLGIGLGYPGMPHVVTRYITLKDDREAKKGAIIFTAWGVLMFLGSVSLGIIGRVLYPAIGDPEQILPYFAINNMPPVIAGIVLAAITAAIMSTADSQLIYSATTLINDLFLKVTNKKLSQKQMVWGTRLLIGILGLIALVLSLLKIRQIYEFVLYAWGVLGAAFSPVVIFGLYWKRFNRWGALASFIVGTLVTVIWRNVPSLKGIIYELVPAFILAIFFAWLVTLLTSSKKQLEKG